MGDKTMVPANEARQAVEDMTRRVGLLHICFARMLVDELGEEKGRELIEKAIWEYGTRIGRSTRARVLALGLEPTPENFGKGSDLSPLGFDHRVITVDGEQRQQSLGCAMAEVWRIRRGRARWPVLPGGPGQDAGLRSRLDHGPHEKDPQGGRMLRDRRAPGGRRIRPGAARDGRRSGLSPSRRRRRGVRAMKVVPPQPMQAGASMRANPSSTEIAANWQTSAHDPQPAHSSASTWAT
jgi:hypothetical protein